jgi:anti-anti-sigma factor
VEPSRYFIRGEIDTANADRLLATLRSVAHEHHEDVVADCMDLTFIDAAGIRALVTMNAELVEHGRHLRLVHPSPFLRRMLDALKLNDLLDALPSVDG